MLGIAALLLNIYRMLSDELTQLKTKIQNEEWQYLIELKTTQRFEILKATRLRINALKEQLSAFEQAILSTYSI